VQRLLPSPRGPHVKTRTPQVVVAPAVDPEALRLGRYVDKYEPDSQEKPAAISLGESQRHTLYGKGDKDWIIFTPPAPGKYRVTVNGVLQKTNFVIYTGRAGDGKLTDIVKAGVKADGWSADVDVDRGVGFLLFRADADDKDDVTPYTVTVQRVMPAPPGKGRRP